MTPILGRTVILTVALGAMVVLVWAATIGPVGVIDPSGTRSALTPPDAPALPAPNAPPDPRSDTEPPMTGTGWAWVRDVFFLVMFAIGLFLLARFVQWVVPRISLPARQLVTELDPLPDPEAARDALSRDRARHREALATGEVRDGIVACWVRLEESAADAGLPRLESETPTEFVVHLLHGLDVDPRPVARLAALYQEARFSSHAMAPDSRARAEAALESIHDDLGTRIS